MIVVAGAGNSFDGLWEMAAERFIARENIKQHAVLIDVLEAEKKRLKQMTRQPAVFTRAKRA